MTIDNKPVRDPKTGRLLPGAHIRPLGLPATGGRKPSKKTIIKRFELAYPKAYDILMGKLFEMALQGDAESARYVIDRLKGRPKQAIDQTISGRIEISPDERKLAAIMRLELARLSLELVSEAPLQLESGIVLDNRKDKNPHSV